jgi:hypothetical protein
MSVRRAWLLVCACISANGDRLAAQAAADTAAAAPDSARVWGTLDDEGFLVGRSDRASLSLGLYMLGRYLNQLPAEQDFTDHLGRARVVDTRHDILIHRLQFYARGFLWDPDFLYEFQAWSVLATTQVALIGHIGYRFAREFLAFVGVSGLPGVRSMLNIAPYFLGTDRHLAEEYFKPGFTGGFWVQGELLDGLFYKLMVGNSLTELGITVAQLTRDLATGQTVFWMPTTHEFGPRGAGAYGDFENHRKLATRFGVSHVHSRENRLQNINRPSPDNTVIRLSDSLLLFDEGALAPGVTVENATYRGFAADAAFKYRGAFLMSEYFYRRLYDFDTDGPVPQDVIVDNGFAVQASYMAVRERLELYGTLSQIYGAFNDASEWGGGVNWYPSGERYPKLNAALLVVNDSPVSSSFGYYIGGMDGVALTASVDFRF